MLWLLCYFSLNDLVFLCDCLGVWSMLRSLGGITVMLITFKRCEVINYIHMLIRLARRWIGTCSPTVLSSKVSVVSIYFLRTSNVNRMTKYVAKISLWNSEWLPRKLQNALGYKAQRVKTSLILHTLSYFIGKNRQIEYVWDDSVQQVQADLSLPQTLAGVFPAEQRWSGWNNKLLFKNSAFFFYVC